MMETKTNRNYTEEGQPVRCMHCNSTEIEEVTKSVVANNIAEVSFVCKKCHKEIGYWGYGSYEPSSRHEVPLGIQPC